MALISGNLLTENQQSAETDVDNWNNYHPSSSAVSVSTTQFHDGVQSLRSTYNNTASDAMASLTSTASLPTVVAGTSYTMQYLVYSPRAVNFALLVEWWNAANTSYISDQGVLGTTAATVNAWTTVRATGLVAAVGSARARVYIMATTGLTNGDLIYFDEIFFGVPSLSLTRKPTNVLTAIRRASSW